MTPIGFDSWREYRAFVLAREFVEADTSRPFLVKKNWAEKMGEALTTPVAQPVDFFLREFRNPLVIVAMTVMALALTSIVFYPVQTVAVATYFLPFLKYVTPSLIKGGVYLFSQALILGLGSRSLGRLSNPPLMEALQNRAILLIPVGAVRLEEPPHEAKS